VLHESKQVNMEEPLDHAQLSADGWVQGTESIFALSHTARFDPEILKNTVEQNLVWEFDLSVVSPNGAECRRFELAYLPHKPGAEITIHTRLRAISDGKPHRYRVGAGPGVSIAAPYRDGQLRVAALCSAGAKFKLENIQLWQSRLPETLREQIAAKTTP
jgi:hypothetical protein